MFNFNPQVPEYDNLYIEMNSIIHRCSHPSDADVYFRVGKKEFTDEEIFENVSRYVELIFNIIRPVNLLYLAFDGVPPRAKVNQQRGTRFRTAKRLSDNDSNAEIVRDLFDGNCVTPGTIFMTKLNKYIDEFVMYKVSTDLAWRNVRIVLSGSEVSLQLTVFDRSSRMFNDAFYFDESFRSQEKGSTK